MNQLGVIVCYQLHHKRPPFLETRYFYQLAMEAKKHTIDLFVFSPKEIDWNRRTVPAWAIEDNRQWAKQMKPLPSLIYDRCYYLNSSHYRQYQPFLNRLRTDPKIRLLGRALSGKYQTHQILSACHQIQAHLPETIRYQSIESMTMMLKKYHDICMKPNGGSHGRGVFRIKPHHKQFFIQGRDLTNQAFQLLIKDPGQLNQWIEKFVGQTRYIIQPYLRLTTVEHLPFDLRILVQKDGNAAWLTTGSAIRIGKAHSLTSNLHGGGTAVSFLPFLQKNYPPRLQEKINQDIQNITTIVPSFIEQNYGPLVELGLDIGIDKSGHVWLLEVNSKPGRSVFLRTGNKEIHDLATKLPILYAKALLHGPRRCNPVPQHKISR